jgi:hypothetical protein
VADVGDAVRAESAHRWSQGATGRQALAYRIRHTFAKTADVVAGQVDRDESARGRVRP